MVKVFPEEVWPYAKMQPLYPSTVFCAAFSKVSALVKKNSKNAASVPLHRTHTHTHTHTHTLTHTHTHTHTHNTHTVDCAAFPEVSALVNKKIAKIQPVYPSNNSLCPGTFTFFFLNPPFRIFHNTDAAIVFRIRSMHIENTFFYI